MTTTMELNMATGLRAELDANRNRSLFGGAQIAINSFYNLQKNIALITDGLSLFEEVNPPIANLEQMNDTKAENNKKIKDNISNNKTPHKKGGEKRENRKKGPSGKPMEYFIKCKSKKEAYEAAKKAGKGEPIDHANPKNGDPPHFHPNRNRNDHKGLEENIQKDGLHFIYPK